MSASAKNGENPSMITGAVGQSNKIRLWDLENAIRGALWKNDSNDSNGTAGEEDGQGDEASSDNLHIYFRSDAILLECQIPMITPVDSILGIYEDIVTYNDLESCGFDDDLLKTKINPLITIDEILLEGDCYDRDLPSPEPHAEWLRTDNGCAPRDDNHVSQTSVQWMDFRQTFVLPRIQSLSTVGDACHFLRKALGTSHGVSPWYPNSIAMTGTADPCENSTQKRNSADATHPRSQVHSSPPSLPAAVVILLPTLCSLTQLLHDFRTTDACPSYFLQSVSRLQLLQDQTILPWSPKNRHENQMLDPRQDVSAFVYRLLSPREPLLLSHNLPSLRDSKQLRTKLEEQNHDKQTTVVEGTLPPGCLWESRDLEVDKDEDNPGDEHDDEVAVMSVNNFVRPVAPPYISDKQDFHDLLEPLLRPENLAKLQQEAVAIPQWTAWPERQHYSSSFKSRKQKVDGGSGDPVDEKVDPEDEDYDDPTWTVFPLCHCFPANQVENRKWLTMTCDFVPQTTAMLRQHLGDALRTALFSRLAPESTLEAHTGWRDLANHVYRVHIPLVMASGAGHNRNLCGTWVDGCVETHQVGRPLCFDDSKVHRAFNYSTEDRVVLILDLARPPELPLGTAVGGHTDELDKFIEQFA